MPNTRLFLCHLLGHCCIFWHYITAPFFLCHSDWGMAAQPEESAQSADLQDPELGHKDGTATEMEGNERHHELPHPHHYTSWKECFHEKVQQRCLNLQETKMSLVQAQKAEEAKVRRREPGDCLARDWYNEEEKTLDTRLYLLDNLLPTLIPATENLLMAVERNHVLVSDQEPSRFKPINYLAEYLMRHNPQYSVPAKPGPYLREMEAVSEELKSSRQGTTSQRWEHWQGAWSQGQSWCLGLCFTKGMVSLPSLAGRILRKTHLVECSARNLFVS